MFYIRNTGNFRINTRLFCTSKSTFIRGIDQAVDYLILIDDITLNNRFSDRFIEYENSLIYLAVDTTDVPCYDSKESKEKGLKRFSVKNRQYV